MLFVCASDHRSGALWLLTTSLSDGSRNAIPSNHRCQCSEIALNYSHRNSGFSEFDHDPQAAEQCSLFFRAFPKRASSRAEEDVCFGIGSHGWIAEPIHV